jgi:hypothetical protein
LSLWTETTGTISPLEWSVKNKICISMLFEDKSDIALHCFRIINREQIARSEEEIDQAINFLKETCFPILVDKEKVEKCFLNASAGVYADLIENVDEYKESLFLKLGQDVYNWNNKGTMMRASIEEYANRLYQAEYKQKVIGKIKVLSSDKAQQLLVDMAENSPLLGLSILRL